MRSYFLSQICRRSPAAVLTGVVLLAGCTSTGGPAPVVNRSLESPQARAPVFDSRNPDTGSGSSTRPANQIPAPEAPLAAANPPVEEAAVEPTDATTGVRSIPIESGRVESSPIAADDGAGSAPIITMGPAITKSEAPPAVANNPVASQAPEAGVAPVASRPAPDAVGVTPPAVAAPPIAAKSDSTVLEPPRSSSGSAPAMPPVAVARPPAQAPSVAPSAPAAAAESNRPFIWPADGAVTKSFTDPKSMGIAISGKAGDRVSAAGDGRVIFSGLGPRGYGKLLIVKHDDDLLSVYANNRALLVKEGQAVRQGQKIAELGSSGTDKPRLHFEIRRLGKPVDPISYLPPSAN